MIWCVAAGGERDADADHYVTSRNGRISKIPTVDRSSGDKKR